MKRVTICGTEFLTGPQIVALAAGYFRTAHDSVMLLQTTFVSGGMPAAAVNSLTESLKTSFFSAVTAFRSFLLLIHTFICQLQQFGN